MCCVKKVDAGTVYSSFFRDDKTHNLMALALWSFAKENIVIDSS